MHLLNALLPVARRLRGSRPRDVVASARFSNTAARVPLLRGRSYAVAAIHVAFLNMQGGGTQGKRQGGTFPSGLHWYACDGAAARTFGPDVSLFWKT